MDVRQLEAFLAVAEHLHFGRAAEQLFMAQAPLSRAIQALERDTGARLFERSTRSVLLTPAGQALMGPAREVMEAVHRAEEAVHAAISGELGVVRVEFCGLAAHSLVASLARSMRADHPGIRLEFSSQPVSRPAMEHLCNGDVDIALGRWNQFPTEIEGAVVKSDSLVLGLPRTHRLAGAEVISFKEVAADPFVSLPHLTGSVTTDRLWRLGYLHGGGVNNVQFAPDTQSCLALVSAEVGCHLALRSVAQSVSMPSVVFVPLAQRDCDRVPDVHLRAIWRAFPEKPVAVALELIRRAAQPERGEREA